jgi:hypothetical protein
VSARLLAIVGYGLAFVLAGGLELAAWWPGTRIPPLGEVCAHVMRYRLGRVPVGRLVILGFWWWLGWHLLAR